MNREYHRWYSGRLERDMELLVFGHSGMPVLFFPTRLGRFYDYENWGVIHALRDKINNGELQLFCVDSVDSESLYNLWAHPATRIARHLQYEQYVIDEVIPLMRSKSGRQKVTIAGCSMGAYHAANLAFKHPELFEKVVCMSGRFDLTRPIQYFRDLFDGFYNDDIYFNMPRHYLANIAESDLLHMIRNLEILLVVGEADPFFDLNLEFNELLANKGINRQFYKWDGFAHTPRCWKKMVQLYL